MAHEDKGKYFKKHPEGTQVSEPLRQEILKQAKDNNFSCKAAEKVSKSLRVSMGEIGVAMDMLNVNIVQCQLGLFGFEGGQKKVATADAVTPQLEAAIRKALVNNRLSCLAAWAIADQLDVKRPDVTAACEALKIKIKPCQLGAF